MKKFKSLIIYLTSIQFGVLTLFLVGCVKDSGLQPLERTALSISTKKINIRIKNYCAQSGYRFHDLFVSPFSYALSKDKILHDFDRDGLTDAEDQNYDFGTDYRTPDWNEDGYGDLVVSLAGVMYENQASFRPCEDPDKDFDLDGLNDCEEEYLFSDPKAFDTDEDGIPDYLEVRHRLRAISRDAIDSDSDGIDNLTEIKQHTPVHTRNNEFIDYHAIRTIVEREETASSDCGTFIVENVPIIGIRNGNQIQFFIIESDSSDKRVLRRDGIVIVSTKVEHNETLVYEYDPKTMSIGRDPVERFSGEDK